MSDWQYNLDIKDLYEQEDREEITPAECGKQTAIRLEKLRQVIEKHPVHKDYLNYPEPMDDIILNFRNIDNSASREEQQDEYNDILDELYDWADQPLPTITGIQKKMCWIKTQF